RIPARDIHRRSWQNGGVRQHAVAQGPGVDRGDRHCRAQRLAALLAVPGVDRLMYHRILVTLDTSSADEAIVAHVQSLAAGTGASIVLMHVADGFAARNLKQLELRESEE